MTRYQAVVEMDASNDPVKRWEVQATCGHLHRTREAAVKCGEKLRTATASNVSILTLRGDNNDWISFHHRSTS